MPTVTELLNPRDRDTLLAVLLELLRDADFPVTSWEEGGVARTLVELDAETLANAEQLVARIAEGGLGSRAAGAWLTLRARNFYSLDREPSLFAEGVLVLTAAPSAGPYTITPGQLWAQSASGLRYTNVEGGTLAQGGTLSLAFRAESPGVAWNVGIGSITTLLTPLPGVAVANPDTGDGTWQTQLGTEEESDESLYRRTQNRWAELGPGAVAEAYENWALKADPQIRRVRVQSGDGDDGTVEVLVAGESGAVDAGVVAAAQAYIDERTPLTVTADVQTATDRTITVVGVVYATAGLEAQALADGIAEVEAYLRRVPLGGTVYRSQIIAALGCSPAVRNVELAFPEENVELEPNEVAVGDVTGVLAEGV